MNTTPENAETFLVLAHKLKIPMIPKLSFTIYFRRSSSTRVPTSHEAIHTETSIEEERKVITSRTQQPRMAPLRILTILISLK